MQNEEKEYMNRVSCQEERSIWHALSIGCLIGVVALIGYSFSVPLFGARLFFIGLLLAVATFVSGSFIGTLFGMPKRNNAEDAQNTYTLNNSLVEISDWLTKIIVGLGLVNLKQLPDQLMSIGEFISYSVGGKGQGVNVFANSIVVYFGVVGIYIGYNYMRLVLSQKYKIADDYMIQKELETVKEVVVQKDKENEKLKTIVQQKEAQTQTLVNVINEPTLTLEKLHPSTESDVTLKFAGNTEPDAKDYTNTMLATAKVRTLQGLAAHKDDPQKGQWGGSPLTNERKLSARVDKLVRGLFRINIRLESINPGSNPLPDDEVVLFVLHDSFGDPPVRLVKAGNGVAELSLIAYGSFTVGAITDKGKTELELDLVDVPGVSEYFKTN